MQSELCWDLWIYYCGGHSRYYYYRTSMISTCTANLNLSLSTRGYTEVECCLIDLDFGDGDDVNSTHGKCRKGKSRVGHNDYVPYRKQ